MVHGGEVIGGPPCPNGLLRVWNRVASGVGVGGIGVPTSRVRASSILRHWQCWRIKHTKNQDG